MNYQSIQKLVGIVRDISIHFAEQGIRPAHLVTGLKAFSIQSQLIMDNTEKLSGLPLPGTKEDLCTLFTFSQKYPSYMQDMGLGRAAYDATLRDMDDLATRYNWPKAAPKGLNKDLRCFNPGPLNIAVACLRPFVAEVASAEAGDHAPTHMTLSAMRAVTQGVFMETMTRYNGDASFPFLRRLAAGMAQMQPVNSANFTQAVRRVLRIDPKEKLVSQGKFLQSLSR